MQGEVCFGKGIWIEAERAMWRGMGGMGRVEGELVPGWAWAWRGRGCPEHEGGSRDRGRVHCAGGRRAGHYGPRCTEATLCAAHGVCVLFRGLLGGACWAGHAGQGMLGGARRVCLVR
mgnify:CR=1 FL=1